MHIDEPYAHTDTSATAQNQPIISTNRYISRALAAMISGDQRADRFMHHHSSTSICVPTNQKSAMQKQGWNPSLASHRDKQLHCWRPQQTQMAAAELPQTSALQHLSE